MKQDRREVFERTVQENRERIEAKIVIPEGWFRVTEGLTQSSDMHFVDTKEGHWQDVESRYENCSLNPVGVGIDVKFLSAVIRKIR